MPGPTKSRSRVIDGCLLAPVSLPLAAVPLRLVVPVASALPFAPELAELLTNTTVRLVDVDDPDGTPSAKARVRPDGTFTLRWRRPLLDGDHRFALEVWVGTVKKDLYLPVEIDLSDRSPRPVAVIVAPAEPIGAIQGRGIYGVLRRRDGGPVQATTGVSLKVVPQYRPLRGDYVDVPPGSLLDELAELPVDGNGAFAVFLAEDVSGTPTTDIRLQLRAYTTSPNTETTLATIELDPVVEAAWVDVRLDNMAIPGLTEFSRVATTTLNGSTLVDAVTTAAEPFKIEDVRWIASATRLRSGAVAAFLLAHGFAARCFSGVTAPPRADEAFYGLLRATRSFKYSELTAMRKPAVRRALRKAVRRCWIDPGFAAPEVIEAVALGLLFGRVRGAYPEVRSTLVAFVETETSEEVAIEAVDLALGGLFDGNLRPQDVRTRIIEAWTTTRYVSPAPFTNTEANAMWPRLVLGLAVIRIVGRNEALALHVARMEVSGLPLGPSDVGSWSVSDWLLRITEEDPAESVPLEPRVPSGWVTTSSRQYARRLRRRAEMIAPSLVFAERAALDPSRSAAAITVLRAMAAFRAPLWHVDLDGDGGVFSDSAHPLLGGATLTDALKVELLLLQRLARLCPRFLRYEVLERLEGFPAASRSAAGLTLLGRGRFIGTMGQHLRNAWESTGLFGPSETFEPTEAQTQEAADALAASIYDRAAQLAAGAAAVAVATSDAELSMGVRYLVPLGAQPPASWCSCDPCVDATSPASYLMELLDLTGTIGPSGDIEDPSPPSLLHRLLSFSDDASWEDIDTTLSTSPWMARRREILDLNLGCDETQVLVPQIDLVIELLEHRVVATGAHLERPEVTEPPAVVPTTTTGSSEARRVEPEHVGNRAQAEALLAADVYPPPLPISLAALEVDELLAKEGLDRSELMADFAKRGATVVDPWPEFAPLPSTPADRAAAWLRWGEIERAHMLGGPTTDVTGWFGLSAADPQWRETWATVSELGQRIGWTYQDVTELLGCRYFNPGFVTGLVVEGDDPCDLSQVRISPDARVSLIWTGNDLTTLRVKPGAVIFDIEFGWRSVSETPSTAIPDPSTVTQLFVSVAPDGNWFASSSLPTEEGRYVVAVIAVGGGGSGPHSKDDNPIGADIYRAWQIWRMKIALGVSWRTADRLLTRMLTSTERATSTWSEVTLQRFEDARRLMRSAELDWDGFADLITGPDRFGRWDGKVGFVDAGYDDRFQNPTLYSPVSRALRLAANRWDIVGEADIDSQVGAICAGAGLSRVEWELLRKLPEQHPFSLAGNEESSFQVTARTVESAWNARNYANAIGLSVTNTAALLPMVAIEGPPVEEDAILPDLVRRWFDRLRALGQAEITPTEWRYLVQHDADAVVATAPPGVAVDALVATWRALLAESLSALQAEGSLIPTDPFADLSSALPQDEDAFASRQNVVLAGRPGAAEVAMIVGTGPGEAVAAARFVHAALQELPTDPTDMANLKSTLVGYVSLLETAVVSRWGATAFELRDVSGNVLGSVALWVDDAVGGTTSADRVSSFDRLVAQDAWFNALAVARGRSQSTATDPVPPLHRALVERLYAATGVTPTEDDVMRVLRVLFRARVPQLPADLDDHTDLVEARTETLTDYATENAFLMALAGALDAGGAPSPVYFDLATGDPVTGSWSDLAGWLSESERPLDAPSGSDTMLAHRLAIVASVLHTEAMRHELVAPFAGLLGDEDVARASLHSWLRSRSGAFTNDFLAFHDLLTPNFRTGTDLPWWVTALVIRAHKMSLLWSRRPEGRAILVWGASTLADATGDDQFVIPDDLLAPGTSGLEPEEPVHAPRFVRWLRLMDVEVSMHQAAMVDETSPPSVTDLLDALLSSPAAGFAEVLATRLGLDADTCAGLCSASGLDIEGTVWTVESAIDLLFALDRIHRTTQRLSARLDQIIHVRAPLVGAVVVEGIKSTLRASRSDVSWSTYYLPVADRLRIARRDALVAWLLRHHVAITEGQSAWRTVTDIQAALLVDPLVQPPVQTSRVVFAMEATQAVLQRAELELEAVPPLTEDERSKLAWMRRYRMWEANRKVFLYPENWTEPDLLVEKTPLFEAFEKIVQRSSLRSADVDRGIQQYLEKLVDLGRLTYVSLYEEADPKIPDQHRLHVLARTRGSDHLHFYRMRAADGSWTPWSEVPLPISGDQVAIYSSRGVPAVFWLEFEEQRRQEQQEQQKQEKEKERIDGLVANYTDVWDAWGEDGIPGMIAPEAFEAALLDDSDIAYYRQVPHRVILRTARWVDGSWRTHPRSERLGRIRLDRKGDRVAAPSLWISVEPHISDALAVNVHLRQWTEAALDTDQTGGSIDTLETISVDLLTGGEVRRSAVGVWIQPPSLKDVMVGGVMDSGPELPMASGLEIDGQGFSSLRLDVPGGGAPVRANVAFPTPDGTPADLFLFADPGDLQETGLGARRPEDAMGDLWVLPEHADRATAWSDKVIVADDIRAWLATRTTGFELDAGWQVMPGEPAATDEAEAQPRGPIDVDATFFGGVEEEEVLYRGPSPGLTQRAGMRSLIPPFGF